MKKFFLTMMFAVAAMAGMAQTIGEAFYIYRNDGRCYTFLRNQVDSIVYSHISTDGVFHDEVVTQLIYTKDSISKMPLLEVDSIGFVKKEELYTSCPDSNHPHWIDLGLPSGTQWRCCNEGASTPEAYGGYYTFGQVSSAPTWDQIKELVNCCKYEWTTQNGVYGGKFTGPNGGTIFLPTADYGSVGGLDYVGSYGLYWSSTPYGEYLAHCLNFYSGNALWGYSVIDVGQSVRPVR
jgi:hypothetical protein